MSKTAKNEDVYNNYNSTRLGEDNEGRKKLCSCAGTMVQVFGLKNNFTRESDYNGISRELPLLPKRT